MANNQPNKSGPISDLMSIAIMRCPRLPNFQDEVGVNSSRLTGKHANNQRHAGSTGANTFNFDHLSAPVRQSEHR